MGTHGDRSWLTSSRLETSIFRLPALSSNHNAAESHVKTQTQPLTFLTVLRFSHEAKLIHVYHVDKHKPDMPANFSSPFIYLVIHCTELSSLFHFVTLSVPSLPGGRDNIDIHYRHSLNTQRGKVAHEHIIEFFMYRREEYVGLCSDTVQIEEKQRRGLLAQLQREDLCLSLCASLQSHLFLSLLFALSLSHCVWNFISLRHFVLYLQQCYITRNKKLGGMLISCCISCCKMAVRALC